MNKEIINWPCEKKHSSLIGLSGTPFSDRASLFIIMGKVIQYKKGDKLGSNLIYLRDSTPYVNPYTKEQQRKAIFLCSNCGSEFAAIIGNVKKGNTTSCGCLSHKHTSTHDIYYTKAYRIFYSIISRCENPKDKGYNNYGARGISIFPEWRHNVNLFYDYVSKLDNFEKNKYVLDRINNDGNYEPGNLRWVNYNVSNLNKRPPRHNTSGYIGVRKEYGCQTYFSSITINKKQIIIARSHNPLIVAQARDNYIIAHNLRGYRLSVSNVLYL